MNIQDFRGFLIDEAEDGRKPILEEIIIKTIKAGSVYPTFEEMSRVWFNITTPTYAINNILQMAKDQGMGGEATRYLKTLANGIGMLTHLCHIKESM